MKSAFCIYFEPNNKQIYLQLWGLKLYHQIQQPTIIHYIPTKSSSDMDEIAALTALMDDLKISTNDRPKEETKSEPYLQMIGLINEISIVRASLKPDQREKIEKAYHEFNARIKTVRNYLPQQAKDLLNIFQMIKGRQPAQSKKIWDCRWNRTGVHQFYRINDYLDDKQFCKRVGHCGFTKDHKRTYCCEKCKATVKNYLNIQQ